MPMIFAVFALFAVLLFQCGKLILQMLAILASGVALIVVLLSVAAAHGPSFTNDEILWMERQHAVDGMKCCNEQDVHIGVDVRWRFVAGRYEVLMEGVWREVPPGRLMRHIPGDPSPWGAAPLLFYSPGQSQPWCFVPEPMM